jgi:hypothetical protein
MEPNDETTEKSLKDSAEYPNDRDISNLVEDDGKYDISKTKTRYVMLFLACFLCFGNYFIYDNPSALETQIEDVIII